MRLNPGGALKVQGSGLASTGLVEFAGGGLEMGAPQAQFGPVVVSSTSLVSFAASPSVLRFADSHGVVLTSGGLLMITNWNGSTNGGGDHQILFCKKSPGWRPGQPKQTLFRHPPRFSVGDYAPRNLAHGE